MKDNASQTNALDQNTHSTCDMRLWKTTLVIGRLGVALLFFSQLFWKLPPHFGCEEGPFVFSSLGADGAIKRSAGLCDWIGIESIFSHRERSFFGIDFNNDGASDFEVNLKPLVRANGWFVDHVVIPHFRLFGWLIFLTEAFIVLSLALGILARLGALLSFLLSVQLMLGLAGVSDTATGLYEWEWSYHLMILLSLMLVGAPGGRAFGLDSLLRPRLFNVSKNGKFSPRLFLALT